MVAVLAEESLEVVVDGIRVAEAMTLGIHEVDGRHILILNGRYILDVVSRQTPETLVIFVIVVITELSLQLQILVNLPTERTGNVQVLTLFLAVVVVSRGNGVVEVTQIIVSSTGRRIEVLQGDGRVDDSVLQSAVGVVGTGSFVGTTTANVSNGIASLEVQSRVLGWLGV